MNRSSVTAAGLAIGVPVVYVLASELAVMLIGVSDGAHAVMSSVAMDLILLAYGVVGYRLLGGMRRVGCADRVRLTVGLIGLFALVWMAGTCASTWVWTLTQGGESAYAQYMESMSSMYWVLAVVMAPVVEEFVFRGVLFNGLARTRMGIVAAAIVSSVVFAAVHGTYAHAAPTFMLGLLCCFADVKFGSVLPGILLHMASNLTSVVLSNTPIPPFIATGWFAMIAVGISIGVLLACLASAQRGGDDGAESDDVELSQQ